MVSRLSLLAMAGTLVLAGEARAADTPNANLQAIDTYLAITGTASAPAGRPATGELAPLAARVIALGESSAVAVVYYTFDEERAGAVQVVTTVATNPEGASAPARFVSHLVPGQTAEVSVAGGFGTEAASLELAYDGSSLTVQPAPAQPEG
jgi:hypothetical protein